MVIKNRTARYLQLFTFLISGYCLSNACFAQTTPSKMDFEKYEPVSTLRVPAHIVTTAKYPFVDVHNHQWNMRSGDLTGLVKEMDELHMKVMVNLSGGTGDALKQMIENVRKQYPNRFIVFANIDFAGIGNEGWTQRAVQQLQADVKNGANGLKVFKNLGLSVKDVKGNRVTVDDSRLDPIWELCGKLGIPVLIHTADPKPFWDDEDEHNERWLEIATHPGRKRGANNPVPWETLIEEQHRMFKKNSGTKFIAAHFGWYANDLATLSKMLDDMPHVYVEFGAIIAELGRQPRAANAFFTKYQNRILFGKDSWVPEEYKTYFRVLETGDEYFPYHKKYHAFWSMYGMALPDDILQKIYYKNALKIVPGIDKSLFSN